MDTKGFSIKAIISFALGMISIVMGWYTACLFLLIIPICITSIILGATALRDIGEDIGVSSGKTFAVLGIILGCVAILITFAALGVTECARYLPDRCIFELEKQLRCDEFIVHARENDTIRMKVRNTGKDGIIIETMYAYSDYGINCTMVNPGLLDHSVVSILSFDCPGAALLEKGVKIKFLAPYRYRVTSDNLTRTATAEIYTAVQP